MQTRNASVAPAETGPWIRMIRTTAGDMEQESRSRLNNFLEAVGMMTFILVLLWPVAYLFGVYGGIDAVNIWVNVLIFAGAGYLLFVSPWVHGDTAESWGLGNPRALWRMLRDASLGKRVGLLAILLALFLALNYANYSQWHEVEGFFKFNKLAAFFGMANADIRAYTTHYPGRIAVVAFGSVLSALIVTCCIRYDNFVPAFKTAMYFSLPLLGLIFAAAYLQRGTAAFARFSLSMWAIGVLGYVFWGFVQQLLFSSYFGTRFRKAFAPSQSPDNRVPKGRRAPYMLRFAAGGGLGAAALSYIGIRAAHGPEHVEFVALLGIGIAAACAGAFYGWAYCLDKKRLIVATLCASCFGLIHIASYGLVAVTWLLGIFLVYAFMEDKNRNLIALGFIHGLLGSTFGQLFSKGTAGVLEVNYSVGPWNIRQPAIGAIIFPMLCIAAYFTFMAWGVRNIREED